MKRMREQQFLNNNGNKKLYVFREKKDYYVCGVSFVLELGNLQAEYPSGPLCV